MKDVTLSADDAVIDNARAAARRQGRSLNDRVRAYLETLAASGSLDAELDRLQELSERGEGHRRRAFSRDALRARS